MSLCRMLLLMTSRARCLVAACMVPAVRPSCSELPKGGVGARWHWAQHTTTPQQPPRTASTPRTRVLTSISIWKGAGETAPAVRRLAVSAMLLRLTCSYNSTQFPSATQQMTTGCQCGGWSRAAEALHLWSSACLLRRPDPTFHNPTHSRSPLSTAMIEVIANDRLGTRVRIKAK